MVGGGQHPGDDSPSPKARVPLGVSSLGSPLKSPRSPKSRSPKSPPSPLTTEYEKHLAGSSRRAAPRTTTGGGSAGGSREHETHAIRRAENAHVALAAGLTWAGKSDVKLKPKDAKMEELLKRAGAAGFLEGQE